MPIRAAQTVKLRLTVTSDSVRLDLATGQHSNMLKMRVLICFGSEFQLTLLYYVRVSMQRLMGMPLAVTETLIC